MFLPEEIIREEVYSFLDIHTQISCMCTCKSILQKKIPSGYVGMREYSQYKVLQCNKSIDSNIFRFNLILPTIYLDAISIPIECGFRECFISNIIINGSKIKQLEITESFDSDIEDQFLDLENIEEICLYDNTIKNIINSFNAIPIKQLSLYGNEIETICNSINDLDLKMINLSINEISCISGSFNNVSANCLKLNRNNIYKIKDSFKDSNIFTLDLGDNHIRSLDGLPNNLKSLYMDNNPLKNIDLLSSFTKLTLINVSYCQLNNINSLKDLMELHTIKATNNNIGNIDSLKNLNKLKILDLSKNNIRVIKYLSNSIEDLSLLKNNIISIPQVPETMKVYL